MILGIGTDLCDVGRIQLALDRHGDRFAQRVLAGVELERLVGHRRPAHFIAKRFAAKEALSKALGTGIRAPVNWHNIEVRNNRAGQPFVAPSERLRALLDERGITTIHLSLTDEHSMACACVVLEGLPR